MATLTQIAIAGANGRMGRELIQACINTQELELSAMLVRSESDYLGKNIDQLVTKPHSFIDYSQLHCCSQNDVLEGLAVDLAKPSLKLPTTASAAQNSQHLTDNNIDVLIDFTLPDNTLSNLQHCVNANIAMLIGTTGFTLEQQKFIDEAASKIAIVQASNMSIGINLTLSLLKKVADTLGNSAKIQITERHHIHKKDSPSGTAITMGEVIAQSLDKNLTDCMVIDDSNSQLAESGKINFCSIREGEVIGDHEVSFTLDGEVIEIHHKASNRQIFANGAMTAAKWIKGKRPGLYSMADVLGL